MIGNETNDKSSLCNKCRGLFRGQGYRFIMIVIRMVNMGNSIAKMGKKTAAMAVIGIKALYLQKKTGGTMDLKTM